MGRALTFNGPVETGLRALVLLAETFPASLDVGRLVVFDYLLVHSDDLPGGPSGLHPKTPHRAGELLVRRELIQHGLNLYRSRGLVSRRFDKTGLSFSATERTGGFLDALDAGYTHQLRIRAQWVAAELKTFSAADLRRLVNQNLGRWGAEFEFESVLFNEGSP